MEARVEELQLILTAKAEAMRDGGDPNSARVTGSEKQQSPGRPHTPTSLTSIMPATQSATIPPEPIKALPSMPSTSAVSAAPPYTYAPGHERSLQAHQIPLPGSVPSYDHSKGEAFTSSPETFSTPMGQPMPVPIQSMQPYHMVYEGRVVGAEEHCPPNVAWLTDELVDSPQPNSGRPAKADAC